MVLSYGSHMFLFLWSLIVSICCWDMPLKSCCMFYRYHLFGQMPYLPVATATPHVKVRRNVFPNTKTHSSSVSPWIYMWKDIQSHSNTVIQFQGAIPNAPYRHADACKLIHTFGGNVSRTTACHQPMAGPLLRTGDPAEF